MIVCWVDSVIWEGNFRVLSENKEKLLLFFLSDYKNEEWWVKKERWKNWYEWLIVYMGLWSLVFGNFWCFDNYFSGSSGLCGY